MLQVIRLLEKTQSGVANETTLQLHNGVRLYKTEDILSATKMVYEDISYSFEVDEDLSSYASVLMFFNKEKVPINYIGNRIEVKDDEPNHWTFKGLLGFLQIRLCLEEYDGTEQSYSSEYASIMVRPNTAKSRNVESMLQYIYHNQKDLLYTSANVMSTGKQFGTKFNDFGSEIVFLEELADVYERNIGYFRANSRFKLEQVDVVDSIYKMQYVNDKTVRHIAEHPDLLRVDRTGIKIAKQSYLPDKTLMPQNKFTRDIYENQVIVGFLKKIIFDSKNLKEKITEYITATSSRDIVDGEYVPSSNLIFSNVMDVLKEYRKRTDILYDRFVKLLSVYSRILPVHENDCSVQPKPTQVFLSVPQYNQIYTAIHRWYQKTGYDFATEKVMLQLLDIPSIYELYVLVKLIRKITSKGYEFVSAKRVIYPSVSQFFDKKESNNTFVFQREDKELTLYYEPAIYNTDSSYNGINLFRNTSVSFTRAGTESGSNFGSYYVPDFLIKMADGDIERYVILDAKYSTLEKVRNTLVPEMVYKYVFSISPVSNDVELAGLGILNGIYHKEQMQSVYDSHVARAISPFVDLVPISEEMSNEEQESNMEEIWKKIV